MGSKLIFIMLAAFVIALVLAKLFEINALLLLLLLCPIMMITMMIGMNHNHRR
ncbi:DUF2933 domain-containing protein [Candidatus Saccharibacteria bacterium]|nr:DUF2933 domain-containing protein [Candidatus Saccharibacteria bacterium]